MLTATLKSTPLCYATGKMAFANKKTAKRARSKRERMFRSRYGIYRCRHCNLFHLTTIGVVVPFENKWANSSWASLLELFDKPQK